MDEKYQALIVDPGIRYLDNLGAAGRDIGIFSHTYYASSFEQALKKLNGSNAVNVILVSLSFNSESIEDFIHKAEETLYGGFSCYIGVVSEEAQNDPALLTLLHGMFSLPASKSAIIALGKSIQSIRGQLENRVIERWLRNVLEKFVMQLDIVVELKKAGYKSWPQQNKLLILAQRIKQLHPDHFPLWESLLLEFLSEREATGDSLSHLHYRGASHRLQRRFEEKIIAEVETRFTLGKRGIHEQTGDEGLEGQED